MCRPCMVAMVGYCDECHRHGYIREAGRTGRGPVMLCKHCRHDAEGIIARLEADWQMRTA